MSKANDLEHHFETKIFKEIAAAADQKKLRVIITDKDTGEQLVIDTSSGTIATPTPVRTVPQQPQRQPYFLVGQSWRGQKW